MGRIVRQATELGVATIVPILCRYSVSRPAQGATHSWELDAKAALKQSGNAWLPEISPPVAFADALSSSSGPVVYGAVPIADAEAPPEALPGSGDISVWVGPEGGFAAEELRALEEAGGQPLCVGPHVLRVDTAVCAVLACVYTLVSRSG